MTLTKHVNCKMKFTSKATAAYKANDLMQGIGEIAPGSLKNVIKYIYYGLILHFSTYPRKNNQTRRHQ